MAIRFNVVDTRMYLRKKRLITSCENELLEEIALGTIGARNLKGQICTEAEFDFKDLAHHLEVRVNKIYVQLKSLNQKYVITRRPTRTKGIEILGLNPYLFGQILIDKSHLEETKRHLKCVVSNSQKQVQNLDTSGPESGLGESQIWTSSLPNLDTIEHEKPVLDSSREDKIVLEGKVEVDTSSSEEEWDPNGPAKAAAIIEMIQRGLKIIPRVRVTG